MLTEPSFKMYYILTNTLPMTFMLEKWQQKSGELTVLC